MNFPEFEHHARLYVLGALEEEEMVVFEEARREYGELAERFIGECRRLNAAFALSLDPQTPREDARERLLSLVEKAMREKALDRPNA